VVRASWAVLFQWFPFDDIGGFELFRAEEALGFPHRSRATIKGAAFHSLGIPDSAHGKPIALHHW